MLGQLSPLQVALILDKEREGKKFVGGVLDYNTGIARSVRLLGSLQGNTVH